MKKITFKTHIETKLTTKIQRKIIIIILETQFPSVKKKKKNLKNKNLTIQKQQNNDDSNDSFYEDVNDILITVDNRYKTSNNNTIENNNNNKSFNNNNESIDSQIKEKLNEAFEESKDNINYYIYYNNKNINLNRPFTGYGDINIKTKNFNKFSKKSKINY